MYKPSILTSILIIFALLSTNAYAGRTTNAVLGTPTVYSVNPQVMQLCNTYSTTTGECSGDIFTFTKTYTANDGFCDIVSPRAFISLVLAVWSFDQDGINPQRSISIFLFPLQWRTAGAIWVGAML